MRSEIDPGERNVIYSPLEGNASASEVDTLVINGGPGKDAVPDVGTSLSLVFVLLDFAFFGLPAVRSRTRFTWLFRQNGNRNLLVAGSSLSRSVKRSLRDRAGSLASRANVSLSEFPRRDTVCGTRRFVLYLSSVLLSEDAVSAFH